MRACVLAGLSPIVVSWLFTASSLLVLPFLLCGLMPRSARVLS